MTDPYRMVTKEEIEKAFEMADGYDPSIMPLEKIVSRLEAERDAAISVAARYHAQITGGPLIYKGRAVYAMTPVNTSLVEKEIARILTEEKK